MYVNAGWSEEWYPDSSQQCPLTEQEIMGTTHVNSTWILCYCQDGWTLEKVSQSDGGDSACGYNQNPTGHSPGRPAGAGSAVAEEWGRIYLMISRGPSNLNDSEMTKFHIHRRWPGSQIPLVSSWGEPSLQLLQEFIIWFSGQSPLNPTQLLQEWLFPQGK